MGKIVYLSCLNVTLLVSIFYAVDNYKLIQLYEKMCTREKAALYFAVKIFHKDGFKSIYC